MALWAVYKNKQTIWLQCIYLLGRIMYIPDRVPQDVVESIEQSAIKALQDGYTVVNWTSGNTSAQLKVNGSPEEVLIAVDQWFKRQSGRYVKKARAIY